MKEISTDGFKALNQEDIQFLLQRFREDQILTGETERKQYDHDYTEDFHFLPHAVIIAETTEEVSFLLKYCNEQKLPLTVRGAGTGLSGGALPVKGGVLLSMEKFDKILEIDEDNFQAIVEPGVITQVFQETVARKGLFYPPDPASRGSCFIGGNLAENSGGPKAVKYGVTKDYVLNLEVVLANGEIIWTGANVLKNATGLNVTQLMIGSEGTLGVITKAVFQLLPLPKLDVLMLVPFFSAIDACAAVSKIFKLGITPSGLEFMEKDALQFAKDYMPDLEIDIPTEVEAHLLIELDGNNMDVLMNEAEQIHSMLTESFQCGEILFADSQAQKDKLWKLRRSLGEAVKVNSIYKEEDTVVKRAALPDLLEAVKSIGKEYGFRSVCYGHAGDGNLHVNILKGEMTDEAWQGDHLKNGIREIFKVCKQLGGTISGEHGIGYVQKEYMDIVFSQEERRLQESIKFVFDPNGILNPGKIWD